jgi:hypothetical protein
LERAMLQVTVLLILCALLAGTIGISVSLLQTSRTISNVGTVGGIGVGIYMDQNCATPATSISWGNLSPGSSKTVTLYVRNEGSITATLSMATNNWNPSNAKTYLTLNWNYAGQTLAANQVQQVTLTLTVSSTVTGISNFGFDIVITAQG